MQIKDIEMLLATLTKSTAAPEMVQLRLKDTRTIASSTVTGFVREDIKQFLLDTKDVDENAIVVLTSEAVTLLVDDKGNLLQFA